MIYFTKHALFRMQKRNISKYDVKYSLKFPDKIIKKDGKHFFRKEIINGKIEICCEIIKNNIKVITVYWY